MVRRLVHVLILVLTLMVGATAMAVIVSQTAWFKDWLRGYVERQAAQYINGQLSIQRLGGNIFFGVELENIAVSMDGSEVVAVKDIGVDFNVFQLIARGISVDSIRVNQPIVYLRREGEAWSISRLVRRERSEADRQGPGRPITIEDIGVTDGSVVVEGPIGTSGIVVPARFDKVDARLSFRYEPVRYSIDFDSASFRASDPSIALNAFSGGVSVHDDSLFMDNLVVRTAESALTLKGSVEHYLTTPVFKVEIASDTLSVPEWAGLIPALEGIALQPAFDLKTDGPLDRLGVQVNVRSDAGQLSGNLTTDLLTPGQSVTGTLSVHNLDLAPVFGRPEYRTDISGEATVDAQAASFRDIGSLRGHLDLNAPKIEAGGYAAEGVMAKADFNGRDIAVDGQARAYGAAATTAGRVRLPATFGSGGRVEFDLRGQARGVDLRRLPGEANVPRAATNITAEYHVAGSAPVGDGPLNVRADARFLPSTIAGATIASGGTARLSVQGDRLGYAVDADVAGLDLQRIGQEFDLPALARDRYASSLNGHIAATGEGTAPRTMTLQVRGALTESSVVGGRIPQMAFDATLAGGVANVRARGSFAEVDPAVVSGKPAMKGSVGGSLDVDVTVADVSRGVTPDGLRASGVISLDASTLGGLEITRATVDGDYENAVGVIRTLDVEGRDLDLHANGTLALNDTGQSSLTVHADSSSLEEIGRILEQPLGGIASLDATVTGNRRELLAAGTLTGGGLTYGETSALSLTSDFNAAIPDLDPARVSVKATTEGTFVSIAGQEINELTATTEYSGNQLTFDAAARQPQRSLDLSGRAVIHADHQEIHLQGLALQSQGVAWTTAPGAEPAIQYAPDSISVRDLRLVSADQQIAADGSFGRPGDALKVTLNNIDLATVDALMLQPPRFSGRLTATGTVTGSRSVPAVDAEFAVTQGGFRDFRYDSLGGTVAYTGKGMTLDARMDQGPATWLTATGYVPVSLFKATTPAADGAPVGGAAPIAAEDRVDLRVDSSPIDLAIVHGVTTELTNVSGTVEAHVHVTGSGADPHPTGSVVFTEGAFTVERTGVSYAHLRGEVELQGDRIHIDNLSVLDAQDSFVSLSGDLGMDQRQVGGVQMYVTARDFQVIDNDLASVRMNSDLEITGELRAPRIDGDLSVNTGRINMEEIVAITGDSAYSTLPTEYLSAPPAADATASGPVPILDALRMNVRVSVPDDLIVTAASIDTPGSPFGGGAFTITLGGDLQVTREPGAGPRILGSVNTIRGFYEFQGRRFTILRDGTIRFQGLEEIDPVLDIRAQQVIRAVTANVNVRGTLRQPEIVLTSTPPLEQADILALIVFNRPANELGAGQQISLAQRVQNLAVGTATGALQRSIGDALNIDEFTINMAPETGGGAQLAFGEQVGQNLYVKVQQGIGAQGQTNFILEYELTDWLRLHTNVLQGSTTQTQLFQRMQGSGIDLLFFFSY